jgi:hypothetical protein
MQIAVRESMTQRRGRRLPYDAEVAYLESTGTQCIDTGLILDQTHKAYLRYEILDDTPSTYMTIFGARSGWRSRSFSLHRGNEAAGTVSGSLGARCMNPSMVAAANNAWHSVVMDATDGTILLNGNVVGMYGTVGTFTTPTTAKVFGYNWTGGAGISSPRPMRFASVRIWSGSTLVQDLIPVRKNGVGYMFDRVSGQLFGNAGTGSFVLGPDKAVPYDAEVEYLESTGTQNINTGITIGDNAYEIRCDMMGIGTQTAWARYFGTYTSESAESTRIINYNTEGSIYCGYRRQANQQGRYPSVNPTVRRQYVLSYQNLTVLNNGSVAYQATLAAPSGSASTAKLFVFGAKMRCWGFSVWHKGMPLCICTPVRKSGVGYMYDSITNSLFGNAGTGSFTIGPDIN